MVMSILTLVPFVWIAAFLPSEARTLPTSVKLHRRFTFVAHAPPQDWSTDSLEDYDQYHFRFLSIGCHQKKTTDDKFFEACCHPRMKSDDLSKIPVQCHLSPQSMLAAHNYILKSTNYRGEITSGVGTPVYVTNGTVEAMKPTKNRSASEPPTSDQLKDLLQAQKKVQILNEQYKSQGNITSSSEKSSSQDMPSSDNTSSKMATPYTVSKALLKDVSNAADVNNASISNLTSKATDAVAKQVSDDAATQKVAAEAAAKKLADDAASQRAADAAAAQKAASDAAAKKAADDAATASKQKSDDASATKSASTQHDASLTGSLSGVSQVFGSDGDAKGTYFYQEGAAGACGNVNSDNTPLVALPTDMYAGGQHCGKQVMIKNTANGKTVIAKVQDMCPGCPSSTSLDLSTGAYDALGSQATGVLPIQWGFVQS